MSPIRFCGCAAIAVSAFMGAARAQSLTGSSPGFHYFYKAGAGIEQHDADLVACALATRALVNGSDAMTGIAASTGGGLLPALIGGVIDNNENRQGAAANTENCMAIRGWSVIGLTPEDGRALEEPDDAPMIHEKLAPYVNSAEASGAVLRGPFANELAVGEFAIGPAGDLEEVSLSVRAVRDLADAAVEQAGPLKPPRRPKGVKAPRPAQAIKASELQSANPSLSYIVMRVSYASGPLGLFDIMFNRLAPDGSEIAYDGNPVVARTSKSKTAKGAAGQGKYADYVIPVPPGVWKMGTITAFPFAADLCFGAPAFTVETGSAVYVGEMSIRGGGGYPLSPDLGVAKEILASNPALAEKVTAAEWTNGFTSDCFGSYAYAYEVPERPFVDMEALKRAAAAEAPAPEEPAPQDTSPSESPEEQ